MKNKHLNIGWMVLAILMISVISSPAQRGYRGGNENFCCNNVPGLTAEQKSGISKLQQQHRTEMQEIRDAWRSSASPEGREVHLAQVSQKVTGHRNEVRSLLNEDQKAAFDQLRHRGQGKFGKANVLKSRGWCNGSGGQMRRYRYGWAVNN